MLKPKKKLTRKKIKEDKLLTSVNKALDFFNKNSKIISMILFGLVVFVLLGYFIMKGKKEANIAASGRLIFAIDKYNAVRYDDAIVVLLNIIQQFEGTENAGIACYYLANSYYYKENIAEAKKYFTIYLEDYSDNQMFESTALAGIASCYAQEGDKSMAAEFYEKAAKKNPDMFAAADYLFSAAQNFISIDQKEPAKKLLQKIVSDYERSSKATEAKILLAELFANL